MTLPIITIKRLMRINNPVRGAPKSNPVKVFSSVLMLKDVVRLDILTS